MMQKILFSLLVSLTLAFGAPEKLESSLPTITAYIEKYRPIYDVPGMAVTIIKDGKILMCQGFGTLSAQDTTSVDEHTVFQIASGSKHFTATLVLRLATEGILSLDDKVSKYMPEFKLADEKITQELCVRDLLSHSIGLDDFAGDTLWHGGLSKDEIIAGFKVLKFKHTFRKDYAYSNIAFGIAGLVIEKATGKPFAQVMKEYLFIPLGMGESSVGIDGVKPKLSFWDKIKGFFSKTSQKIAKAHDLKEMKAYTIDFYDEFYLFPGSSGVNTTAHDMAKWLQFHLNGCKTPDGTRLIREDLVQEMLTKHADGTSDLLGQQFPKDRMTYAGTALGSFVCDYNGITTFKQMGGITGARSLITFVPSQNLGIAIIANLGGMRATLLPEALTHRMLDIHYSLNDVDWADSVHKKFLDINQKIKLSLDNMRLKNPTPSGKIESYVGKYRNTLYGDAEILVEGKDLILIHRNSRTKLTHLNGDYFTMRGREFKEGYGMDDICYVEFGRDTTGRAFGFVISLMYEGANPTFERVN